MTKLGSPLAEGITSSQNTALAPSVWLPPPSTSSNTYDLVNDVASGVDTIQHDPLDFPDYRTPPPCRPSLHSVRHSIVARANRATFRSTSKNSSVSNIEFNSANDKRRDNNTHSLPVCRTWSRACCRNAQCS